MSIKQPTVSIIIPSYNNAHTISGTLKSCLDQTFHDFEIIVIDDGSTDNTQEILDLYIKAQQIRYFYKPNGRAASARNIGLQHAKGEFIQFLDADDKLHPDKLNKQINYLKAHPEISGVYCDFLVEKNGKLFHYSGTKPTGNLYAYFLDSSFILPIHAPLIRNISLPSFNEILKQNEDRAFWLDYFSKPEHCFDYIDEPLVQYCLHETNTTYNQIENIRNMLKLIEALPKTELTIQSTLDHHGLLGFALLESGNHKAARAELKKGIKTPSIHRKILFAGLYILSFFPPLYRLVRLIIAHIRRPLVRKEIR